MINATDASSSVDFAKRGVIGVYEGNSFTIKALIVFCSGLSMYNALELIILIFLTFSNYHSFYFWALLISTLGIINYSIGFLLMLFDILSGNGRWVSLTIKQIGWFAMITGQSLVLWSRLHLIVSGERGWKILLCTKWMIIVDAIILQVTATVVTFGSNGSSDSAGFVKAYNVVEKIQMTGFFVQELILSSIYISETLKVLRVSLRQNTRKLMHQLVLINIAIIIMDMGLLGMEYASLFLLETITKSVFYSIKLKLEFAILSRLVKFVHSDQPELVDHSRSYQNLSTISSPVSTGRSDNGTCQPASQPEVRNVGDVERLGL